MEVSPPQPRLGKARGWFWHDPGVTAALASEPSLWSPGALFCVERGAGWRVQALALGPLLVPRLSSAEEPARLPTPSAEKHTLHGKVVTEIPGFSS